MAGALSMTVSARHRLAGVVNTGNNAQAMFVDLFPALAGMLFFHENDGQPSQELIDWKEGNSDKIV